MKLRKILGWVARAGRPILKILGVKGGTVATKAAEIVEVVEEAKQRRSPDETL